MASTNRPIFGQEKFEFHSFEELFPAEADPPPPPKIDPAKIVAACEKHGLKPPIFKELNV